MAGKKFFVSAFGSDLNPGTFLRPFRTVAKGVTMLQPGDVLNLRQGTYVEAIEIKEKNGTESDNIVIRSAPGEHAFVDGCLPLFREFDNSDWVPAFPDDPSAHPDEYVSSEPFSQNPPDDPVNRGAFLNRIPYTRLITYSKLEDLRASNQTFDRIQPEDPRPGPEETDKDGILTGFRRPWVYMGPGVFFDKETRYLHIRLSPTENDVEGVSDYDGPVDPRKAQLAISNKDQKTLIIRKCSYLRIENLSLRFGGESTLEIRNSHHLMFDHVQFRASTHGIFVKAGNEDIVFSHCELDGGLPTWYFRSDRKSGYHFMVGNSFVFNNLGEQTSRALLLGNPNTLRIEFSNCEFVNGHDINLFGRNVRFHHNWIDNINDEAMFVDAVATDQIAIFQNVITRSLSAISFAGGKIGGPKFIYRNLVDLRQPTIGYRPRFAGDKRVFRFGHLFKSNPPNGPLDLFHNTCLVSRQEGQASYLHYRDSSGPHPRRSFNNIFVAIDSDRPIAYIPSPSFPGPTDGNCYFRVGNVEKPLFRFLAYKFNGTCFKQGPFETLCELRGSQLFEQSKTQYEPGYEASSINSDPQFLNLAADGSVAEDDDFRLSPGSLASSKGIVLPPDLKALDPLAPTGKPDIGCYQGQIGLSVGVDGRRRFPDV